MGLKNGLDVLATVSQEGLLHGVSKFIAAEFINTLRTVVTLFTTRFNIKELYVLPTKYTSIMCLYGPQIKQHLFPCTALFDWFL